MFYLNYTPPKSDWKITHTDSIFSVGSCFAENIGTLLKDKKFTVITNPHGILFNPISLAKCIQNCLNGSEADVSFFVERSQVWFSYHHHSQLYATSKLELQTQLNAISKQAQTDLLKSNVLLVTFGSAYVYRHIETQKIVANCHKQVASLFKKELVSVTEIVSTWKTLITLLQQQLPHLKIVFTVSPVKHLKDGLHENNLSKSTLLLSINELIQQTNNCYYFSAYELVNDDLRDYRFYKADMAHPNEQAVNYVWQKFSECYFSGSTLQLNTALEKLHLAYRHKLLQPQSEESKQFKKINLELCLELKKTHPFLNLSKEEQYFES
jgi:hypothetical protein